MEVTKINKNGIEIAKTISYKFIDSLFINKFILLLCEKVFTHMNTWMIGKNSIKRHYLKKNIFIFT